MRALAVLLTLGLVACGERLTAVEYNGQGFVDDTSDPGENAVEDAVAKLPWKHTVWKYKFNSRRISRLTLSGDLLFIETPENTIVGMDRFSGQTVWMYHIDTDTPLDWPPASPRGCPRRSASSRRTWSS